MDMPNSINLADLKEPEDYQIDIDALPDRFNIDFSDLEEPAPTGVGTTGDKAFGAIPEQGRTLRQEVKETPNDMSIDLDALPDNFQMDFSDLGEQAQKKKELSTLSRVAEKVGEVTGFSDIDMDKEQRERINARKEQLKGQGFGSAQPGELEESWAPWFSGTKYTSESIASYVEGQLQQGKTQRDIYEDLKAKGAKPLDIQNAMHYARNRKVAQMPGEQAKNIGKSLLRGVNEFRAGMQQTGIDIGESLGFNMDEAQREVDEFMAKSELEQENQGIQPGGEPIGRIGPQVALGIANPISAGRTALAEGLMAYADARSQGISPEDSLRQATTVGTGVGALLKAPEVAKFMEEAWATRGLPNDIKEAVRQGDIKTLEEYYDTIEKAQKAGIGDELVGGTKDLPGNIFERERIMNLALSNLENKVRGVAEGIVRAPEKVTEETLDAITQLEKQMDEAVAQKYGELEKIAESGNTYDIQPLRTLVIKGLRKKGAPEEVISRMKRELFYDTRNLSPEEQAVIEGIEDEQKYIKRLNRKISEASGPKRASLIRAKKAAKARLDAYKAKAVDLDAIDEAGFIRMVQNINRKKYTGGGDISVNDEVEQMYLSRAKKIVLDYFANITKQHNPQIAPKFEEARKTAREYFDIFGRDAAVPELSKITDVRVKKDPRQAFDQILSNPYKVQKLGEILEKTKPGISRDLADEYISRQIGSMQEGAKGAFDLRRLDVGKLNSKLDSLINDPKRIKAIEELAGPEKVKDLRVLQNLTNGVRDIEKYFSQVGPLKEGVGKYIREGKTLSGVVGRSLEVLYDGIRYQIGKISPKAREAIGAMYGIETDEEGNLDYNLAKGALGAVAGKYAGAKRWTGPDTKKLLRLQNMVKRYMKVKDPGVKQVLEKQMTNTINEIEQSKPPTVNNPNAKTQEFYGAAGGLAGVEVDEEGNITFNPETAALGALGGTIMFSEIAALKRLKQLGIPEEKITKALDYIEEARRKIKQAEQVSGGETYRLRQEAAKLRMNAYNEAQIYDLDEGFGVYGPDLSKSIDVEPLMTSNRAGLTSIIKNEDFWEVAPELKDVTVVLDPTATTPYYRERTRSLVIPQNTIDTIKRYPLLRKDLTRELGKDIIHELQHGAQHTYGMETGGNLEYVADVMAGNMEYALNRYIQKRYTPAGMDVEDKLAVNQVMRDAQKRWMGKGLTDAFIDTQAADDLVEIFKNYMPFDDAVGLAADLIRMHPLKGYLALGGERMARRAETIFEKPELLEGFMEEVPGEALGWESKSVTGMEDIANWAPDSAEHELWNDLQLGDGLSPLRGSNDPQYLYDTTMLDEVVKNSTISMVNDAVKKTKETGNYKDLRTYSSDANQKMVDIMFSSRDFNEAKGLTGNQTGPNVKYFGGTIKMEPLEFLNLALRREKQLTNKVTAQDFANNVVKQIQEGKKVRLGPPKLWLDVSDGQIKVVGHEGRHRTDMVREIWGNQVDIPVDVQFYNEGTAVRREGIKDEWLDYPLVNQDGKPTGKTLRDLLPEELKNKGFEKVESTPDTTNLGMANSGQLSLDDYYADFVGLYDQYPKELVEPAENAFRAWLTTGSKGPKQVLQNKLIEMKNIEPNEWIDELLGRLSNKGE